AYRHFLEESSNGAILFGGLLSLYGVRDAAGKGAYLPHDIWVPNVPERPNWLGVEECLVGSYGEDGAKVVVERAGSYVSCRSLIGGKELYRWHRFEDFLVSEVERIAQLL